MEINNNSCLEFLIETDGINLRSAKVWPPIRFVTNATNLLIMVYIYKTLFTYFQITDNI